MESSSFDYTSLIQPLASVLVITLGAFGIANRWQTRRENSIIKRDILTEYEQSTKKFSMLIHIFLLKIKEYYEYDDPNYTHIPKDVFFDNYEKMLNETYEIEYDSSKLLSSLRLFYKDHELEKDHYHIYGNFLIKSLEIIRELMKIQNPDQIKDLVSKLHDADNLNLRKIKEFELKLIDKKLHKSTI